MNEETFKKPRNLLFLKQEDKNLGKKRWEGLPQQGFNGANSPASS